MRIESDLLDHESRVVSGVKGLKARPFSRRFANAKAMEHWLKEVDGDVTVYEIKRSSSSVPPEERSMIISHRRYGRPVPKRLPRAD